jgi:ketosteroid isomerase-like protein
MDAKTSTKTKANANAVTVAAMKHAIETRDGRALSSLYADDALLRIVDRNNPPSKPREVKGRHAISTFWDDICSRAMTHRVETSVASGNQIAFSQACAYPDGMKVLCLAICELNGGKIARQTVVQAWDE